MLQLRWIGVVGGILLLAGCDDGRGGPGDSDGAVPTTDGSTASCTDPPVAACAMDAPVEVPLSLDSSTMGEADDFGDSSCGRGGAGAPDIAFRFTAPEAGLYEIDTEGAAFDTMLSVRRGCDGEEITCNDDIVMGRETASRLSVELGACETVVIVVDGYGDGEMGDVTLHVSTRESACDDGADNDGDGQVDCDDPDCFSAECSGGDDWPADWQALEWEVLELTNQRRAEGAMCADEAFGPAPPLEMDAVIREAARKHSLDMGNQDYFEHDSLDGRTFSDRMSDEGFMGASPWGENIAAGQPTAQRVVDGWMDSPGHCRNIMNPAYRTIGIGYAYVETSSFGHYWTQDFAASH